MRTTRSANRRLHKKQKTASVYVQRYAGKYAIAARALVFQHADGAQEEVTVSLFMPHDVAVGHWRCPHWVEGPTFREGGYTSGADSMQALMLAMQSMPARLHHLARTRNGVFTCDGQRDLGFPRC